MAAGARDDFFDTLFHSEAVVGMNTTAMIEAAILGKSVLTVLVPEFAQETTLHFHYLLNENGGFLHVAPGLEEHVRQLSGVLDEDEEGAARRRAFVESFVRPRGLDRPAAPIGAEAIEELAGLRVANGTKPGTLLRRPPPSESGRGCSMGYALSSLIDPRMAEPRRRHWSWLSSIVDMAMGSWGCSVRDVSARPCATGCLVIGSSSEPGRPR